MTAPALYRYFDHREQLLIAVVEPAFELFEVLNGRVGWGFGSDRE